VREDLRREDEEELSYRAHQGEKQSSSTVIQITLHRIGNAM